MQIDKFSIDERLRGFGYCPCCGDFYDFDDFPKQGEFTHETALIQRYGTMPCKGCSDDHVTCARTGIAVKYKDAYRDQYGEYYVDEDAMAQAECEVREDKRHERIEGAVR